MRLICRLNRKAHDTCYFPEPSRFGFWFSCDLQGRFACAFQHMLPDRIGLLQSAPGPKVTTIINGLEPRQMRRKINSLILSTSTKQLGVFARGSSSLISSCKRLQVVEGGFSRQKRRVTGSSSLVGTLDRTMFAFDLCTATLMRSIWVVKISNKNLCKIDKI